MKCPIGDQQEEITRLKTKSDQYATKINSNSLTRSEAKVAYEVFYLPALRYSLNITAINQMDMETIQTRAITAFLTAQGYNRHMPREVVFAPTLYQEIGMKHLYDLQGSDSTRVLLQELNQEESMTQKMLITLLEVIQLEAGIGQPMLEGCRPLKYIEWGWIPQIRDFLHHINGKILHASKKPVYYREHDEYLMDSRYKATKSPGKTLYPQMPSFSSGRDVVRYCNSGRNTHSQSVVQAACRTTFQIHNSLAQTKSTKPAGMECMGTILRASARRGAIAKTLAMALITPPWAQEG
jgi:hypothetical protein